MTAIRRSLKRYSASLLARRLHRSACAAVTTTSSEIAQAEFAEEFDAEVDDVMTLINYKVCPDRETIDNIRRIIGCTQHPDHGGYQFDSSANGAQPVATADACVQSVGTA